MSVLPPAAGLGAGGAGGAPKQSIFPIFLSAPGQGSFLTSTFNVLSFYAPIIIIVGVFSICRKNFYIYVLVFCSNRSTIFG